MTTPEQLARLLADGVSPATALLRHEPLGRRTTLRVGGPADLLAEPASEADLARLLCQCRELAVPVFVLGRGSNLLVRDGGVRGVVISLAHPCFRAVQVEAPVLRCGAGARLKEVAVAARQAGLAGFEFLEGIPGSVGGALRMNAGAMGSAMFDLVEELRCMEADGQVTSYARAAIPVEYRCCPLLKERIVLAATLRGKPDLGAEIERRARQYHERRWATQPAAPSAGCIFKNPAVITAGRLIDELGLKGTRVGGARVSDEHANFIVTEEAATARDVLQLIALIRQRARQDRGIELEPELQIVGEET